MAVCINNNSFFSCGDRVCVPIKGIENNSEKTTYTNLKVKFNTPKGLILEQGMWNIPKGSFDPISNIWHIGDLLPGEKLDGGETPTFCYTIAEYTDHVGNVIDIDTYEGKLSDLVDGSCFLPYEWNFKIYNECTDCKIMSKSYCERIDGVGCCQVEKCLTSGTLNCEGLTY